MIYLAGPIDQADYMTQHWRHTVRSLIKEPCYDPFAAFAPVYSGADVAGINEINNAALDASRAVLVYVWNIAKERTVGTWMEVERALQAGKRVVLVTERFPGSLPTSLQYRGIVVAHDLAHGCDLVQKIDQDQPVISLDMSSSRAQALADISKERDYQDETFATANTGLMDWYVILGAEHGEVGEELKHWRGIGIREGKPGMTPKEALGRLRKELVQVAAVSVAMVEKVDNMLTDIVDPMAKEA